MSDNSHPIGKLPETGYVRQSQLIPVIFPFSSATLWRKVRLARSRGLSNSARESLPEGEDIRSLIRDGVR